MGIIPDKDVEAFWRDGVICVRQAYSPAWVAKITAFLDDIVSRPSAVTGPRDFVLYGPGAAIAQQVFKSKRVSFYYDQIFIKDVLTPEPTPWHHDATFWPLAGDQIASLWTSVDPVDAESSALEFIAGSHRWPQRYRAIGADGTDYSEEDDLETLPDINGDTSKYNIVSWALEPGDALLFHARTLHGARGNKSTKTKRRAIATRWCGDDVVYRAGRIMEFYAHGLKDGDPLCSHVFPQVWPKVLDEQIRPRMSGPILPDPAVMSRTAERLKGLERVEVRPDPAVTALLGEIELDRR